MKGAGRKTSIENIENIDEVFVKSLIQRARLFTFNS